MRDKSALNRLTERWERQSASGHYHAADNTAKDALEVAGRVYKLQRTLASRMAWADVVNTWERRAQD